MARWTRFVLRFRWPILAGWLVVLLAGGFATSRLTPLLSNTFTVPGTDSERARTILQDHFGDRSDGEFLVVYKIRKGAAGGVRQRLDRSIHDGARAVPGGKATALRDAPGGVVYGSILSSLNLAKAKGYTDDILHRLRPPPGVAAYVSGQAAIQHDLDPIFSRDLKKGESIAIPIALVVLLAVFGLSFAATIPLIFAAATITGTLGIVYIVAHHMTMATYVTNLVQLIGLGIAIDYSLLVVYRVRRRGLHVPRVAGPDVEHGMWARLATAIMHRPLAFLAGGIAVLVAAAVPVFALQLTPGSAQGIPQTPQSVRGLNVLRGAVGPGALSPAQIVIDAGPGRSVRDPGIQPAVGRLTRALYTDPEVALVQSGLAGRYVDASGRYEQVIVAGRHEYGDEP